MNRSTSDTHRQLVCSVFQRQNMKTSLVVLFFSENIKISCYSILSKSLRLMWLSSTVNAQTEASSDLSGHQAPYQDSVIVNSGSFVFVFIAIFNLSMFEHSESG